MSFSTKWQHCNKNPASEQSDAGKPMTEKNRQTITLISPTCQYVYRGNRGSTECHPARWWRATAGRWLSLLALPPTQVTKHHIVLHKNFLLRVSFIYGITFQFTLCNHLAQDFLIFRIGTVHLQRFQPHVFFFLIRKAAPLLLRIVFLDRAVHIHFFFRPAMTVNPPRPDDVVLISFKNNCGVPCSVKYQFVF